jgi:hypothetical protein
MAGAKTPRPFFSSGNANLPIGGSCRREGSAFFFNAWKITKEVSQPTALSPLMPRVIQLILPHFPAQSIPMYPQHLRGTRLIPILPLQHPFDEFLLELRHRLFQQYPALYHHPNQRFQLFFHDDTLRMSTGKIRRIKYHASAAATIEPLCTLPAAISLSLIRGR